MSVVFLMDFVVVQFYPWFKFSFLLFINHHHSLPYVKTKEKKFKPRMKLHELLQIHDAAIIHNMTLS